MSNLFRGIPREDGERAVSVLLKPSKQFQIRSKMTYSHSITLQLYARTEIDNQKRQSPKVRGLSIIIS